MKRLLTSLLLCICGFAMAKEIHVSKNGNDNNTGTQANPYLTIQKAASIAIAGDIVIVHEGIYREMVEPSNNGTATNPITFKAANNESVVVSAVNKIDSWTLDANGIYKANVTMPLGIEKNALFYNSNRMDIARWPNNADNDPYTPDAKYISGGSGSHIEYSGIPNYDWSEGYMWYLGAHSGASWTRKITSTTTSRVNFNSVDISKWPFGVHNPTVNRNGHKGIFYLFNSKGALDIEREYFYNSNEKKVYFKAPSGENPSNGNCEYRAREYVFKLTKNYIILDGITTFGGIVLITGDHNSVKNSTIKEGIPILDELDNTDAQIGSGALTIEGSHTLIEKNLIEGGTANGISLLAAWKGSTDAIIRNNVIRNFNTLGIHAEPIRSNCPNTIVENNTIYGGGRSGIYVSGANAEVAYNNVYDVMKINADGGVFYTVGNANYKNSEIHHNWFHSSTAAPHAGYKVAGIYLDNNSKGYKVYRNVVYDVSWTGIQINWDNWGLDFFNNTIYNASEGMGRWENGYTMDDVVLINNYASTGPWYGTDIQPENIINENNPFKNSNAMNFEPVNGSYLVNSGKIIPGYTDGYNGSAPDIGAYENGGTRWVPGADWTPDDNNTSINSVVIREFPTNVQSGETFTINVDYSSTAQHEIVVLVNDPSGSWITSVKQTVSAGNGSTVMTIDQPQNWTVNNNYQLGVSIRPIGGDFSTNLDYVSANFNVTNTINDNSVEFNSSPSSVKTGEDVVVKVDYIASEQLDIVAIVNAPNGTWLANKTTRVNAGAGTISLNVIQNYNWNIGSDYKLGICIRPVGGDFDSNLDYKSTFFNVTATSTSYSFQNQGSFNYISSANPDQLETVGSVGSTEYFEIIENGDGTISLRGSNGNYVSSENGTKELTCTRTSIGIWEKFILEDFGNDIYALKGNNDLYVRDNMLCTSTGASNWQKFKLNGESSSARTISRITLEEELSLYPNPSKGEVKISWGTEKYLKNIKVFNLEGKELLQKEFNEKYASTRLDLSGFHHGVYILRIELGGENILKKIVIQ